MTEYDITLFYSPTTSMIRWNKVAASKNIQYSQKKSSKISLILAISEGVLLRIWDILGRKALFQRTKKTQVMRYS